MALVLHIESDARSRKLVRNLLQSAGHQLHEAMSGLEGVRLAGVHHPAIILVSVHLPDLDGYEVTLRLRGMPASRGVPIVVLTSDSDHQTALAVGANGVVETPLDGARFARTIERFLRGHRERSDGTGEFLLREQTQKIVERLERKVVELSQANKELEEIARLRREFLQNVSHELATPMTPVVGYLRLLLGGDMGELTPLQEKCLKSIEASTQRLRGVIDTLLDVSSLETERMHFYSRSYDFASLARKALENTRERFRECGITLFEQVSSKTLPAKGDPDKLQRAMVHVLDNAVKFTPTGGEVAVDLSTEEVLEGAQRYCFRVSDNGPGIAGTELTRIFEPFHQVDGSVTRRHGGVGLGLAFARRVSEAMGGSVEVQSPPEFVVAGRQLPGTAVLLRVCAQPKGPAVQQ